jgi:hypothetical protein
MMTRVHLSVSLFLFALVSAGCGDAGPPRVPVNGQITYAGGNWPKPATLDFTAEKPAEGMPNLPESVEIKPDGKFETRLVPGEYVINITCWEIEPAPDDPSKAKSYVPEKYHKTGSPERLRVSVPLGSKGPIEVDYDIVK